MSQPYGAFENLRKHNAVLHESVALHSGSNWLPGQTSATPLPSIAITTRSVYTSRMATSYHKTAGGWKNGGGPDRFCLMPKESESSWDIRDDLSFVHLYCTDAHLREVGEKSGTKALIASRWTSILLAAIRGSRRFTVSFCLVTTGCNPLITSRLARHLHYC